MCLGLQFCTHLRVWVLHFSNISQFRCTLFFPNTVHCGHWPPLSVGWHVKTLGQVKHRLAIGGEGGLSWLGSARREIITERGQSYVSRLPKYWPPTPLSARRVCPPPPPPTKGGEGVGGQYFGRRETWDWPLIVIISLYTVAPGLRIWKPYCLKVILLLWAILHCDACWVSILCAASFWKDKNKLFFGLFIPHVQDRVWSVTQMIVWIWLISCLICLPPLVGQSNSM